MSSPFTFLHDLTLPLVAYLTGRAFNDIMLNAFRDARIEVRARLERSRCFELHWRTDRL